MAVLSPERQEEDTKTKEAWVDYLDTCRTGRRTNGCDYDDIEAWAWQRLQHHLRMIESQRR